MTRTIDPVLMAQAGTAERAWRDTPNMVTRNAYEAAYNAAMNPDHYDYMGRSRRGFRAFVCRIIA